MKRNKVLLGLYVGLLTLAGGAANAQNGFYEIGPANVGGHISSLVADQSDTMGTTVYAGAAMGGLFVRTADATMLTQLYTNMGYDEAQAGVLAANTGIWHRIPYTDATGNESVLPISCMAQTPDGAIFIGTGNDDYPFGTMYQKMSVAGKGLYRYDPATSTFSALPYSISRLNTDFNVINKIAYYKNPNNGNIFLYVGTSTGLFRWTLIPDGNTLTGWENDPVQMFTGDVDQIVVSQPRGMAYFASGNQLYRIGNAEQSSSYVNISASNPAFGGANVAIKLALAPTNPDYVYAMVIDRNGVVKNTYQCTNGQTWTALATSTVTPILYSASGGDTVGYDSGKHCGAVTVDPTNADRIIVGGTTIYVGQGYFAGAMFQWTSVSASEYSLNYGDYMSTVFSNSSFVHSNIHQILPVMRKTESGTDSVDYYVATDGGVYLTTNDFVSFKNINMGLNNLHINGLAVAPDGTLISGAASNACPIIETHLSHNVADSNYSERNITWYHDGSIMLNHEANVLWTGNGGAVAASAFQQVYPQTRRTIFTSAGSANLGRSYADYLDYTNTTTWTVGESFLSDRISGGPEIGSISLWETDNNTINNDSVLMGIDTLGYILRPNGGQRDTMWVNDTAWGTNRGTKFKIQKNDIAIFHSRANADYPFEYKFKKAQLAGDSIKVLNPIQSRMLAVGDVANYDNNHRLQTSTKRAVWFSWSPTDFTKVWDSAEYADGFAAATAGLHDKLHYFTPIYTIDRSQEGNSSVYPRQAVFSRDGRYAYINVYDVAGKRSQIVRVGGFADVNYADRAYDRYDLLKTNDGFQPNSPLTYEVLTLGGSQWLNRPVSNIIVDGHANADRLVLTFETYNDATGNVAIVNNASTSANLQWISTPDPKMPVYTALVEDSTRRIYIGTADGVFYREPNGTTWNTYANLTGVPVTAIVQQTYNLPIRRNLTHTGINANNYVFAKTKWPRAMYFGTYGRGIFVDMQYVTDLSNEVVDSVDYTPVGIPTVQNVGMNSVKLYPNPVYGEAHLAVNACVAGNGVMRVYDLNGRLAMERNLGFVTEGEHTVSFGTEGMSKGMYLINVIIGGHTATAKMMVR
jgi:hypothetical protein